MTTTERLDGVQREPNEPSNSRPRHRRKIVLIGVVLAAAGLIALIVALTSGGPAPLTAACKRAVAAQDAYVQNAVAQGYPNVDVVTGGNILFGDAALIRAALKVCPPTVKADVLPG